MAEGRRMTAAEVVVHIRDGRLEDLVREAVVLVARKLMEAEISTEIGAELGEVAPEARVTHPNGYGRWSGDPSLAQQQERQEIAELTPPESRTSTSTSSHAYPRSTT